MNIIIIIYFLNTLGCIVPIGCIVISFKIVISVISLGSTMFREK